MYIRWVAWLNPGIVFTEEYSNRTRVTVTWKVYGKASPEEMATFIGAKPGMTQGWTISFEKLEALLAAS